MQAKEFMNRPNHRTNFPFQFSWDMVDQSRVLQIVQKGNGNYSNYTFSIAQQDENNFLNLVLKEKSDGFYAALFKYEYQTDTDSSPTNALQEVNKYNLSGEPLLRYSFGNQFNRRSSSQDCVEDVEVIVEYDCWNSNLGRPCDDAEEVYVIEITSGDCDEGGGDSDGSDWGTPFPDTETGGGTSPGGGSSGDPSSPDDDGGSPSDPGEAEDDLIGLEPPLNGPTPLPECGDGEVRIDGVCVDEVEVRTAILKSILEEDPFALIDIPCEELSQAWKDLAEHKPNQAVKDRVQQLNQESYDIEMQYIEDASGAIVNMDYFPVEITQLPENPATGETFTGREFFNYIRENFADICFNDNTSFGPYNQTEAQRWNSTNYLGTVMRFDIAVSLFGIFPGQQDGSVLCTDQQNQSWIFSTIYTSQDHSHPVSGNRQFGLTANPDGTYTFYTAGVDRVAESFDELVSELPNTAGAFEGGEEIWSSLQNNLKNFINDTENGGTATVGESSIERIDIEELEAVLNGTKSVSDLGCN